MLVFRKINIEGFSSIQSPLKFELDRGGVQIIRGTNGFGKSTIFNALFWCLYGSDMRGMKKDQVSTWEHLRGDSWRGTRVAVTVELGDGEYVIARHIGFSGTTGGVKGKDALMIFRDGELLPEERFKKDKQSFIDQLLGMDSRIFLNSVLFGQRMLRLISSSNEDKRQLFEELFDITFIEQAKLRGKAKIAELTENKNTRLLAHTEKRGELKALEMELSSYNDAKERFAIDKAERVSGIEGKIQHKKLLLFQTEQKLTNARSSLDAAMEECKNTLLAKKAALQSVQEAAGLGPEEDELRLTGDSRMDDLNLRLLALQKRPEELKKEIKTAEARLARFTDTAILEDCPTCKQPLDVEQVKQVKVQLKKDIVTEEKVIATLKNELLTAESDYLNSPLHAEIVALSEQIKQVKEKYARFKDSNRLALELPTEIDRLEQSLLHPENFPQSREIAILETARNHEQAALINLESDLQAEQEKEFTQVLDEALPTKIEAGKKELEKIAGELDVITRQLSHYDWWVSKGFGAGGLKAYVFNSMLEKVNERLKYYAGKLGIRIRFTVDLSVASKPFVTEVYKDKVRVDYRELSGGQKQRVDICLAFTMFDIISLQNPCNIMILDEVMEGLDEDGCAQVYEMIRSLSSSGRTIYLITHLLTADIAGAKVVYVNYDKQLKTTVLS